MAELMIVDVALPNVSKYSSGRRDSRSFAGLACFEVKWRPARMLLPLSLQLGKTCHATMRSDSVAEARGEAEVAVGEATVSTGDEEMVSVNVTVSGS